jgi:hypothetical protein
MIHHPGDAPHILPGRLVRKNQEPERFERRSLFGNGVLKVKQMREKKMDRPENDGV